MKYSIYELFYLLRKRIPSILIGKYIKRNLIYTHWGRGLNNFGDCLSPDILRFYGLTPTYVSSYLKSDILLAGSILQLIPETYTGYIIGTGGDKYQYTFPHAKIVAVRGKLTRENFSNNQRITLGDPGLLMSYVYPEKIPQKYLLGIIPHFVDANEEFVQKWKKRFNDNVIFIDPLNSPRKVITQIKSCKHVISSSLHGLIIADAFHIPNIRFVSRKTMPTPFYDYKFDDYYSSLNIESTFIETNGDESIDLLISKTTTKPEAKITEIQNNLHRILNDVAKQFKNKQ